MTREPVHDPLRIERRGAVLEVTLDRPRANAIDGATSRRMGEVFAGFRDDPDDWTHPGPRAFTRRRGIR